ncbi:glycoside hydrolase family 5 protein [Cohnella fermenti]|uniref:Glycoside hydrolase family 5 protein n=1 Tax=Cohnella fermenti TaxID=2565925 RepID=A0A4S4C566_9BACL|nr:glycoside hydrolase family 5 protein [Cohnella fermenti]THF82732.1 glycoside hydrolase family 5 protein [Cohnella fermenti]
MSNEARGASAVRGFIRADGTRLVDGDGEEILLRGVGLGSWLLPEGYMWRMPDGGDRPRRIERMIRELIGPEKAEAFWEVYFERYIGRGDIERIAEEGFNSVRVPINWRFLTGGAESPDAAAAELVRADRLRLIDRAIGWCREFGVYVILDLHGAPGGQTGTNIDDSERDRPDLFLDERYRRQTVELWRLLAERYKDERIVAGYDLLNEPLPDWFAEYNDRVMPLYQDIVRAIRAVDNNHLIILEGVHWATDWSIFTETIDGNMMLQFHKYWNNPDTASIRTYLEFREAKQVPIFMGEGGENNPDWYAGAFRLFEEHRISWNFWTWKKLDTSNSPCSIRKPAGWERLAAYAAGLAELKEEAPGERGIKLEAAEAERILQMYLDSLPLERCDYRPDVARALLRRVPVRIPAIFYGCGGEGIGYGRGAAAAAEAAEEAEVAAPGAEEGVEAGEGVVEGEGVGFRAEDGVDIRFVSGRSGTANFRHMGGEPWSEEDWLYVRLHPGEWLSYGVEVGVGAGARVGAEVGVAVGGAVAAERVPHMEGGCSLKLCARLEPEGARDDLSLLAYSSAYVAVALNDSEAGRVQVSDREWSELALPGALPLVRGDNRIVIRSEGAPIGLKWLLVQAD